ncbi:MAG TPA: beta-galactosidase trimerization domain-containing protein, partial [Verrucomicrobiae bacterium]|nr:beta-galactosidase trimerization domain-containing protein [Verrucomicrobiae bacterium]
IAKAWEKLGRKLKTELAPGVAYNFQDEICCRPPIGTNAKALQEFRAWLNSKQIPPANLGVASLDKVMPIETPDAFREQMKNGEAAARRNFYYTARFRQHAATERLIWNTAEFRKHANERSLSSTLVADHPYFAGTGLGMGFEQQNNAWGGWPLAMDWFDIGRRRAVDLIGIEDWMGLQFMYGPAYTWEGFQLLGFQAAIFRSASRGEIPVITWITPSDERNLRLKFASALAQGAKHLFYWTYGPTATSTENYWSDQPGSYPGMAHISRLLEMGEPIIAPGKPRRTRVALLYSISSDLWQPFGYIHMLERRGIYLALVHQQFLVDFLTEEDLAAGRLSDYRVLYTADPCISDSGAKAIRDWVNKGSTLVATCAAGSRNEFAENSAQLAEVFGIRPQIAIERQAGDYRTREKLNDIPYLDHLQTTDTNFGVIGLKASVRPRGAKVKAKFTSNNAPALLENRFGKGRAVWFATTPGISYIKDAKFVAKALAEKWPQAHRHAITRYAMEAGAAPLAKLSEPVVETGIFDAPAGTALILANFTYTPIKSLQIELPLRKNPATVKSLEHGPVEFDTARAPSLLRKEGYDWIARFNLPLVLDDLLLIDTQ